MKTLTLVRHGKSSWNHDLKDSERPLKDRAYADAEKVIAAFRTLFNTNATLWSSYAVRALETATIFKQELQVGEENFLVKEELYTFNPETLLLLINSCNDDIDNLMLFGHNPAITEVVNILGDQVFSNIPTTGLVQIEFDADSWKEIKRGRTLVSLFPKNL